MKKIRKKGELTTQQIVMLIILIASFAVILFLVFRLNLAEESEQEICRNSVLLKANSAFEGSSSLTCYRSYECITADGTCEELTNPERHEVENINQVYDILAENMADCWWMFGEGSVNYVGKDLQKNNYCSICSQIYLDDSLDELEGIENNQINKEDFEEYLSGQRMPNRQITYSQYLFGTNNIAGLRQDIQERYNVENVDAGEISIGEQFFVVMGITSSVDELRWTIGGAGAGAAGGAILGTLAASGPIGWIGGAIILGVGGAGAGAAGAEIGDLQNLEVGGIMVEGKGIENRFMAPTIIEANSEKFDALNCQEVVTLT